MSKKKKDSTLPNYDVVFEHKKDLTTKYENVKAATEDGAALFAGALLFDIIGIDKIEEKTNYALAYVKRDDPIILHLSLRG
jgi:hypothetical protein